MRNEAENAVAKRADVVVHHMQKEALQIGNIAGLVKGHDLAVAIADNLRSQDKAINDKAACRRSVSERNDRLTASHPFHRDRQMTDSDLVLFINFGADPQPLQERFENFRVIHRELRSANEFLPRSFQSGAASYWFTRCRKLP